MPHFNQISTIDLEDLIPHITTSTCQLDITPTIISDSRPTHALYYELLIVYWIFHIQF